MTRTCCHIDLVLLEAQEEHSRARCVHTLEDDSGTLDTSTSVAFAQTCCPLV